VDVAAHVGAPLIDTMGTTSRLLRRATAVFALTLAAAAIAAPAAADNYALVVTGASGGDAYAKKYDGWRRAFVATLLDKFAYPPDHIIVLAEKEEPDVGLATSELVKRTLTNLRSRLSKDDLLFVLLIGHGTSADDVSGEDAKFNLVGPDLTATEWAALLKPLAARLVFVDTTAVSYPFLRRLSAPGRIIVTATDSSAQEFETVFAEWFVKSVSEMAADTDKNGRVSMLEAFTYASAAVRRWYDEHNQLPTEHPLLDDDGDGVGHEAPNPSPDGGLSRSTYLQLAGEPVDAPRRALVARRAALEREVDALKARRSSIAPDVYQMELERLLLELARVSAELRTGP
jgi:hypothetical protein